MRAWITRSFLSIDPRTLALTRIYLGAMLLVDLFKRALDLSAFYTDSGLLPREAAVSRSGDWSPFYLMATRTEVALGFLACALVYGALLVGYRTRLAQVLSLLCALSVQHRVDFLTSGGDIVETLLCWWTLPLPLGLRWSIDATRRPQPAARRAGPVVSLAVLGASLQLALIYGLNAAHKNGATWYGGTAVHYVLWLDRVITPLAVWYRSILSPLGAALLTYGTLVIEGGLPLLILSPWGRPWTRRGAILAMVALHGGISSMINVGMFSAAMLGFGTLLVSVDDWTWLSDWAARHGFRRAAGWLGRPDSPGSPPATPVPRAGHARLQRVLVETGSAVMIAALIHQSLLGNRAFPNWLRPPHGPAWIYPPLNAARFYQGWSMFAPDVGLFAMTLIFDAETVDGRHVDPYNEAAGANVVDPLIRDVPIQIGKDVLWHHYTMRLPGAARLFPVVERWIFDYDLRTGRPEDRVQRFTAYLVIRYNPVPGRDDPGRGESRVLFSAER